MERTDEDKRPLTFEVMRKDRTEIQAALRSAAERYGWTVADALREAFMDGYALGLEHGVGR